MRSLMMSLRHLIYISIIGLFVLGLGCAQEEQKKEVNLARVQVVEAQRGSARQSLRYSVTLRGSVEVRVFSQVPDRIRNLNVEVGDQVTQGQLIAVISHNMFSSGLEAALAGQESARAQLESLRQEMQRVRKLHAAQAVGDAQLDRIEKQVQAAEAGLQRLQAMASQAATQQSKAFVRAPITGVVGQRFLEQGDMAVPQVPIVTIVQMDELKAEMNVPEFELPRIDDSVRRRLPVWVRTAGLVDSSGERLALPARIIRISPTIDLATRMAAVEIRLPNPEHKLRPGVLAEVEVVSEQNDSALLVPAYSVLSEGAVGVAGKDITHVVFELIDGVAHKRTVRLGMRVAAADSRDVDRVEILEGLADGAAVVFRGQHLLRDGDRVEAEGRPGQDEPKTEAGAQK